MRIVLDILGKFALRCKLFQRSLQRKETKKTNYQVSIYRIVVLLEDLNRLLRTGTNEFIGEINLVLKCKNLYSVLVLMK